MSSRRTQLAVGAGILFVCSAFIIRPCHGAERISVPEQAWMQEALDNWQEICESQLHLNAEPLPWIIFYDEFRAWHVNPELARLPSYEATGSMLKYHGKNYSILAVENHSGELWVPDRPALPVGQAKILTSPYEEGKKSFVICALPALVQHPMGGSVRPEFRDFLLGIVGHEMTHTRQTHDVDLRFKRLEKQAGLPPSFDDNVVENTFSGDREYRQRYETEQSKLLTAALQDDEPANGRRLVAEALALMHERRARYFTRKYATYSELEDIFLSMEGIGQWVHFNIMRKKAPAGEPWQQTAQDFLGQTKSWIQWEGFALFILINRQVPDWQARFFAADFPSPFEVLEKANAKMPDYQVTKLP